jgi:translation initiation factor 1A
MTNHKGGKSKKHGSKFGLSHKREVLLKDDFQEYGIVEKLLGDMRVMVLCSDSTTKICHIRGKFKRRVWINIGDTVLISIREFQDGKADIIHKYTSDEAEILKNKNEFDPNQLKNLTKQDGSTNIQDILLDNFENNDEIEINFDDI